MAWVVVQPTQKRQKKAGVKLICSFYRIESNFYPISFNLLSKNNDARRQYVNLFSAIFEAVFPTHKNIFAFVFGSEILENGCDLTDNNILIFVLGSQILENHIPR
jgi:hypothetical protein